MRIIVVYVLMASPGNTALAQLYFTSDINTQYAHEVCQKLVQRLQVGNYRTTGNIRIEEARSATGSWIITLSVNSKVLLNYNYSTARIHRYISAGQLSEHLLDRLEARKLAAKTKALEGTDPLALGTD